MKKAFSLLCLLVCLTPSVFAQNITQISDSIIGLKRLQAQTYTNNDEKIKTEYLQYFDENNCPKSLYVIQKFIENIDSIITSSKNPNETRSTVYSVLTKYSDKASKVIDKKVRDYLLKYYDNDLGNDYTNGCLGNPHHDNIRPSIQAGRIQLEGYVKFVRENYFPDCQYGMGDCENGFSLPSYKFVLTKDIQQQNLPQGFRRTKAGSEIPFGCLFNEHFVMYQYDTQVLSNTYRGAIFGVSKDTTARLLASSKAKPLKILGGYGFLVDAGTHGHIGDVCGGEFRTIDIVK